MSFRVGFRTDVGLRREQNQDSAFSDPDLGLFLVADGMGGHRGGETASGMVSQVFPEVARKLLKEKKKPSEILKEAIRQANRAVFQKASETPELKGMGTTTTAILVQPEKLTIGHVGDSRCYYFRPGAFWQLTRDHSLVQEKFKAGIITREQMKTDRMRNVITRSVGLDPDVQVELYEMDVYPGDVFMLCSDGLSGLIPEEEMLEVVQKLVFEENQIEKAAEALVDRANAHGGDDNITCLMVQVGGDT